MVHGVSIDLMVVGLFIFCWSIIIMVVGFFLILVWGRPAATARPAAKLTPLEEVQHGLTRMVEDADWLEGDRLNAAVKAVASAREAIDNAARLCGRSTNVQFQVPPSLSRVIDETVETITGSSSVIAFECEECGQKITALLQFPKVGGRPETTDPLAISARSDWRESGFTVSSACKRCQKLVKKKFLYETQGGRNKS
ncbi:MAG: hypothetical protein AAB229_06360 [Candidatus Hydrogenedentota bacterium]